MVSEQKFLEGGDDRVSCVYRLQIEFRAGSDRRAVIPA